MDKSVQDVADWLTENDFGHLVPAFKNNLVDGEVLFELTPKEIRKSLGVSRLGDVKRFEKRLAELKELHQKGDPTIANNGETYSEAAGKLFLSVLYLFLAIFATSLTMTIAHTRLPDARTYPPLPDIFLDNVPLLPWAFPLCEILICAWMSAFALLLLIHKHRNVIARRYCLLCASLFLLRCVTMLVTSLSVPGEHLQRGCTALMISQTDRDKILQHAWEITRGLGMTLSGVKTCGDYMFSGHTLVLTLCNLFITEYTPYNYWMTHILSWISNILGMILVLCAHEHYTIDVIIAFTLATRIFSYYHTVSNTNPKKGAELKVKYDFFLFSFMEENVSGVIPNEFEYPWTSFRKFIQSVRLMDRLSLKKVM